MKAVCELWRRIEAEGADRSRCSDMMNRLYGILGREVSKDAAENWEAGNKGVSAVA